MAATAMLVLTTCSDTEAADSLADRLVSARLAACVNRIDKVVSTYRWQDAVHRDPEVLLLIKTTEARLDAVAKAIREASSYELPEFVAVRVDTGAPAYLAWLAEAVTGS